MHIRPLQWPLLGGPPPLQRLLLAHPAHLIGCQRRHARAAARDRDAPRRGTETEYARGVEQRRDRVAHSGRAARVGSAPVRRKVRTSAFSSYVCVCVCV